jgi:WD40 repeat protein
MEPPPRGTDALLRADNGLLSPSHSLEGNYNTTHIVQKERPEELHHSCVLHDIDILRPRRGFSHGLDKLNPCLLVRLKNLQEARRHLGRCKLWALGGRVLTQCREDDSGPRNEAAHPKATKLELQPNTRAHTALFRSDRQKSSYTSTNNPLPPPILRARKMLSSDPSLEQTLSGHRGAVCSLSFSPSMRQLASGGTDNTVMVWNFKPQMRAFRYVGHTVRRC